MAGAHAMAGAKTKPQPLADVQANVYGDTTEAPTTAAVYLSFLASGVSSSSGSEVPADYAWLTQGNAADVEVYFQTTSGTLSSGTANTWLSLGSNQVIGVSRSAIGTKVWTGTVIMRRASDGVELDRANVTLSAEVTAGGG